VSSHPLADLLALCRHGRALCWTTSEFCVQFNSGSCSSIVVACNKPATTCPIVPEGTECYPPLTLSTTHSRCSYALNYYNPYTFLSIGPAGTADFAAVARVRWVVQAMTGVH
jgi:hypothetical protein